IAINADGSQLQDCQDTRVVNGTSYRSSVQTQASGNGQSKNTTTSLYVGATTTFTATTNDFITIADTGDTTETIADAIGGVTTLSDTTTIVTSADKRTVTTSIARGADGPY